MSLDRNSPSSLQDQLDKLSLQTIDSLPDELLLPIFANLSPFERALLLQICKKWNQIILLHTPFWQYLHLSESFSPSSIVKILSIFNERSGCRLRHVIIEMKITAVKHLNRIFVQLKRSGSSLKVVAVLQERKLNGKTRALAMQYLPVLDSLMTFSGPKIFPSAVIHMFSKRVWLDIQDQGSVENGLRFYFTEALLQLTQEDLKWFSQLKYLWVNYTDDIMTMRRILERTENLVDLDLPNWATSEEPSSTTITNLSLTTKPVYFKNLKEMASPDNVEFASVLVQMLEIDGDQTLLSGLADSLVLWKVTGLKAVSLSLGLYKYATKAEVEISVEKTSLLFQLNSSIQSLTLRCNPGGCGGGQYHINRVLELLDTSSQPQESGTIAGGEADPSSPVDNLALPHLVKLTIVNPITLDGKLLQKIIKSRTERNSQFKFEFKAFDTSNGHLSEVVDIDDWEARGWMN